MFNNGITLVCTIPVENIMPYFLCTFNILHFKPHFYERLSQKTESIKALRYTAIILSHNFKEDSLCATTIIVFSFGILQMTSCTILSLYWSNTLVASSKIKISISCKNSLARMILCRCPPESFIPLSPTQVS